MIFIGGDPRFVSRCVAADGKVYCPSENGRVYVMKAGPEFDVLAMNDLGETCMSSPALSKGIIYFRTRSHLVAIGKENLEGE